MNQLSKHIRYIDFDVRPFFMVYEDICQTYRLATSDNLKGLYDVRVRERVQEFEMTYPMIEQGYPWNDTFDEDQIKLITDHLRMRPILTEFEIVDILEIHHMLYLHDGEYRNMPIVGVW